MRCGHGFLVLAASVFVFAGLREAAPLPRVQALAGIGELPVDDTNSYRLAAIHGAAQKNERFAEQGGAGPMAAPPPTKQVSAAAAPADAAGRYSILRDGGKDTGCMLTFDTQAKGPGGKKASLAPGCRDQGIVIFNPAFWQIVNGRLVLTARKGHKAHLDPQPDGTWKKDPKEGKSLILKKL